MITLAGIKKSLLAIIFAVTIITLREAADYADKQTSLATPSKTISTPN